jgi:hypothetical protein
MTSGRSILRTVQDLLSLAAHNALSSRALPRTIKSPQDRPMTGVDTRPPYYGYRYFSAPPSCRPASGSLQAVIPRDICSSLTLVVLVRARGTGLLDFVDRYGPSVLFGRFMPWDREHALYILEVLLAPYKVESEYVVSVLHVCYGNSTRPVLTQVRCTCCRKYATCFRDPWDRKRRHQPRPAYAAF